MNVLILTPDAVGGTLLARTLTIYMQFHEYDHPVINVGHAEVGLEKYYCPNFNQEIVRATDEIEVQSLKKITEILKSTDHYKILKLPHYNICSRRDSIEQQIPFYQYLNKNYFIISCRRDNIFEHALSWSINKVSNRLNVFNANEKIRTFFNMYQNGINIDPLSVIKSCEMYRNYLQWCDDHFQIASYYTYEKHMNNLEKYILSLPIFGQQKILRTWKDVYDQEFNDWNRAHYFSSDLGALADPNKTVGTTIEPHELTDESGDDIQNIAEQIHQAWCMFAEKYQEVADVSWPSIHNLSDFENLSERIKKECIDTHGLSWYLNELYLLYNKSQNRYTHSQIVLPPNPQSLIKIENIKQHISNQHKDFLDNHLIKYQVASQSIDKMKELGILPNGIPIKKQTMAEKKLIVKNFDECQDAYNNWIVKYPQLGQPISDECVSLQIQKDKKFWSGIDHNTPELINTKSSS